MITGHTRFIAHLGVPTETFKAPMIYNPWFEAQGIDCVVVPMGCEAEDLPDLLPALFRLRNIQGALITMPHKVAVLSLLDEQSTAVQICGACNAVRRSAEGKLQGDMFDGEGFVRGLQSHGCQLAGASAIVAGCGGVGSAICASLAAAAIARLSIFDPRRDVCEALAARLRRHYPGLQVDIGNGNPTGHDIVVNATPLGMNLDDPLPFDPAAIDATAFVGEVVMKQQETPFIAAARTRGCRVQVGTDMLFEQIPAYLSFFGYPQPQAAELRQCATIVY